MLGVEERIATLVGGEFTVKVGGHQLCFVILCSYRHRTGVAAGHRCGQDAVDGGLGEISLGAAFAVASEPVGRADAEEGIEALVPRAGRRRSVRISSARRLSARRMHWRRLPTGCSLIRRRRARRGRLPRCEQRGRVSTGRVPFQSPRTPPWGIAADIPATGFRAERWNASEEQFYTSETFLLALPSTRAMPPTHLKHFRRAAYSGSK